MKNPETEAEREAYELNTMQEVAKVLAALPYGGCNTPDNDPEGEQMSHDMMIMSTVLAHMLSVPELEDDHVRDMLMVVVQGARAISQIMREEPSNVRNTVIMSSALRELAVPA